MLLAAVAGLSTFDPTLVLYVGPVVGAVVFLFGNPMRWRVTVTVLLTIAFVAWVAVSGAYWSVNPDAVNATLTWVSLAVIFLTMIDAIQTVAQLRAVAVGYLLGCLFAVARTIAVDPNALFAGTSTRLGYENLNVNYLAYALAAGFAVVVLLWNTGRRNRFWLVVTTVALVAGIELTGTRGAYLGLILAVLWLLVCWMFKRPPLKLLIALLVAAAFAIVTGIADQASLAFEGDRATGDWSGRLSIWPLARQIWADNPFIGIGADGFRTESGWGIAAHNAILETGAGLGVIGVALLVAIVWTTLRNRDADPRLKAVLLGTFLAASAPAYLTGVWELAPASWIVLAMFSRITVARTGTRSVSPYTSTKTSHPARSEGAPKSYR